jgi:hypothetical protein
LHEREVELLLACGLAYVDYALLRPKGLETPPVDGFVSATDNWSSSFSPSPRQALPCMQASVVGCCCANRSRMALVCGECAK